MAYVVHVVQRWLTNYNPFYLENKNRGNNDSDWRPKWSLEELGKWSLEELGKWSLEELVYVFLYL